MTQEEKRWARNLLDLFIDYNESIRRTNSVIANAITQLDNEHHRMEKMLESSVERVLKLKNEAEKLFK